MAIKALIKNRDFSALHGVFTEWPPADIADCLKDLPPDEQAIVWVKPRAVLTRSHYMWMHEPCFYGWVEGKMPTHYRVAKRNFQDSGLLPRRRQTNGPIAG